MAQQTQGETSAFPRGKLDGDTRFLEPQVMARINNIELIARFIVEGFLIGLHKSPYHGFSSEFSSYRKYAKGDPFRFIDWKVVGKTDRIYIKQFEEQTNTRCYLLLDASASMSFGGEGASADQAKSKGIQKWVYGRNLCAAFAYLLNKQGDASGLAIYRDGPCEVIAPRGGIVHLHHIFRALSACNPERGTNTQKGLSSLPERLSQRGLVVLISDLLDDPEKIAAALRGFRIRRHEVIVFQILTPEERTFPYRENIEFVDAETGHVVAAQSSYIATSYRQALEDHTTAIKGVCRQLDIDFVPLSTDDLLSTALIAFINRRQRTR